MDARWGHGRVLLLMQGQGSGSNERIARQPKNMIAGHLLMAVAGFWGGFIQIGMGFVILPIMHRVMGLSLIPISSRYLLFSFIPC